jgi:hypothetical protein
MVPYSVRKGQHQKCIGGLLKESVAATHRGLSLFCLMVSLRSPFLAHCGVAAFSLQWNRRTRLVGDV